MRINASFCLIHVATRRNAADPERLTTKALGDIGSQPKQEAARRKRQSGSSAKQAHGTSPSAEAIERPSRHERRPSRMFKKGFPPREAKQDQPESPACEAFAEGKRG